MQGKGYRPVPGDFPEVFVRVGWIGIEQHYRANWRTVCRWIEICGKDGLRQRRATYLKVNGYNRRKELTHA